MIHAYNMKAELDAALRSWGNSYGIIIPAATARRLHLRPGTQVHVTLSYEPGRNEPDDLPKWDWGGKYDIDAILDEED